MLARLPRPVAASLLLLGSLLVLAYGIGEIAPRLAKAATPLAVASPPPARARSDARQEAQAFALLQRWSPSFAREVSSDHPERDRPLAIDFDGDWDATNNWSHLTSALVHAPAVVYGSAILTSTHAYLTYTLFYPRDWFSPVCFSYVCHDNDLEVVELVVQRAAGVAGEALVLVESKAHFEYVAVPGPDLETDGTGRPWLRVESQGHGMYPVRAGEALPSRAQRLVLHPEAGAGEEPYQLASLRDTLWARRSATPGALWISGETGFLAYTGARQGRRGRILGASMAGHEYKGGVRPPWGLAASSGARGDWFLDPAYVSWLEHPAWFGPSQPSLEYAFNPFLADLAEECLELACPPTPPPPAPSEKRVAVAGGLLLATGLASLRARRRARAR
jgi:hypothetical protein